ncbi:MAG: acyl-CoA dehydrogenase family protein [Acidimicrobiia bacterium]
MATSVETGATGIFTPEQEELRTSAKRFLEEKSKSEVVRQLMETDTGFDEGTWKQMADLGWVGIHIPEEYGGVGYGFIELSVLLEEMGKKLLCAPFLSSAVLGAVAVLHGATDEQKKKILPGIADGTTRATLAFVEDTGRWDAEGIQLKAEKKGSDYVLSGVKSYVVDGHTANLLIVAARTGSGISFFSVDPDADGVTRTRLDTLDWTRKQAKVEFSGTKAELLGKEGEGAAALSKTLDLAAVALSNECIGGAQFCLDQSVDYAKTRIQFGRPIGSFQAIKHKCANVLMEVEMGRSAAYYAAWAAAEDDEELPVVASLAKAYCSEAFFHAAAENIQIHGGIGFTWEHDAHLYFKRAKSNEIYLGDGTYHRELLAQRIGV